MMKLVDGWMDGWMDEDVTGSQHDIKSDEGTHACIHNIHAYIHACMSDCMDT